MPRAAGAVVTGDTIPDSVYGGVPARRAESTELISCLVGPGQSRQIPRVGACPNRGIKEIEASPGVFALRS